MLEPAASDTGGDGQPVADRVIAETAADVWRLHAHLLGRDDADDLTQETFERVVKALPGYRGDASVRVWVLSIAHRTASDEIRRRTRRRRLLSRLSPAEPEAGPGAEQALHDLVARLHPDRRAAFVLTQLLGYPYAEAAGVLGVPVGTVRSRVARARADLVAGLDDPRG